MLTVRSRPARREDLWDGGEAGYDAPQPLRAVWDPIPDRASVPRRADRPIRQTKRRSSVGWFFHRYGWRAYVLPLLIAATVFVVTEIASTQTKPDTDMSAGGTVTQTLEGQTDIAVVTMSGVESTVTSVMPPVTVTAAPTQQTAPDPNGQYAATLTAGALPPGAADDFAASGDGTYRVVPGTTGVVGTSAKVRTYTVEIENGVTLPGGDADFAKTVDLTLADARSWTTVPEADTAFQRVDTGEPNFRISLTSQMTVRELCGFSIQLEASCFNRDVGRVVINDARWVRGAVAYNGDLGSYRQYAINHEVGHVLNFGHQPCVNNGALAPVMMQQSWSTANNDLAPFPGNVPADGKVCKANPWPDPMGGEGQTTSTG